MPIDFDDLFCPECRSYVHVFLDRCPACGEPRRSRYSPDLSAGPIGPSTTSPGILEAATVAVRRNMLTSRGRGLGSTEVDVDPDLGLDVPDLFNRIARVMKYRAVGTTGKLGEGADVGLRAADGELRLEELGRPRVVATVELCRVLSATPVARAGRSLPKWAGIATRTSTALPRPAGPLTDVLVLHSTDFGVAELGVGNRTGLLASTARPDHYEEIVRWLGVLAAIEAGRRAEQIGAPAYLAELGLAPPSTEGAHAGATEQPSTAAALRELEELRTGGLVTDVEYERKRREILDRL